MDPSKEIKFPKKSLWHERESQVWSFFCPLCKSARKIPYQPRPGKGKYVFQILLSAAFFTLVAWSWFSWKGVVSVVPLWAAFELFYRARMRAALSCPYCGFDPFLYKVDVKWARKEVESHWRKIFKEKGVPFPEKNQPISGTQKAGAALVADGNPVAEAIAEAKEISKEEKSTNGRLTEDAPER